MRITKAKGIAVGEDAEEWGRRLKSICHRTGVGAGVTWGGVGVGYRLLGVQWLVADTGLEVGGEGRQK